MTTGDGKRNGMPFSHNHGDGSFAGMDWSLPLPSDFDTLFDLNDPMLQSQYEFDPALPSLLFDSSNFGFPAADDAFVDYSDLRSVPPVSFDTTPPLLTTPSIYTSQTEASPQLSAHSPSLQEHQNHKQRTKKVESGFPCIHPGCAKCFDRACDLRKHAQRTHTPQEKREYKCPHANCNKRFVWPKDVARHRRQVHGEDPSTASSPPPPSDLSPATTRSSGNSGHGGRSMMSNPSTLPSEKKPLSGPPAKRQRQLLSALPGKLSTTLWLCRSVVLLKGLRLRRKSTRSDDSNADESDPDAPGEVVDEDVEDERTHAATTMAPVTATTTESAAAAAEEEEEIEKEERKTVTVAAPSRRWLLITSNRVNFRAVEITGADTAEEVLNRVRRAAGARDGVELALREFSFQDGVREVLSPAGLMTAVHQRAGEKSGLMLLLTAAKKHGAH